MEGHPIVRGLWMTIKTRTAQGLPLTRIATELGIDPRPHASCGTPTPSRPSRYGDGVRSWTIMRPGFGIDWRPACRRLNLHGISSGGE